MKRIGYGEGGDNLPRLGAILTNLDSSSKLVYAALAGELAFAVTPETVEAEIDDQNEEGYFREVTIELVNDDEERMNYTGTIAVAVSESTVGDGAASLEGSSPIDMVEGVAVATINLTGTWAADDTNTLTVSEQDILKETVAAATSVETSIDTSE